MKKIIIILTFISFLAGAIVYLLIPRFNEYQLDGEIQLEVLNDEVTIHRDEHGIPYVFAENTADLFRAQGFVVAQDRLFQIEMYRAIIQGRLASIIGASGLDSDIQMSVLGLRDQAASHYEYLDEASKDYLRWYAQGHTEFVSTREDEYP
ncbi:MAG: penicillin acylase family protein, partial [Pseudomonadota bacterium]